MSVTPPRTLTDRTGADIRKARHRNERDEVERRRTWHDFLRGWGRNVAVLAGVLVAGTLLEGIYRAAHDVRPRLASVQQGAQIIEAGGTAGSPAQADMSLAAADEIVTDDTGRAVFGFPDGSGFAALPNSRLLLRLLDATWSGKRSRTLHLKSGEAFARVSRNFGPRSHALICTDTGIAAARAGSIFLVRYSPGSGTTVVDVLQGDVHLRSPAGRVDLGPGDRGMAAGSGGPTRSATDVHARERMQALSAQLQPLDAPPNVFRRGEGLLLAGVDPLFRFVGLTPQGWNLFQSDASRRGRTMKELQRLQQELTGESTAPDVLNGATLAELQPSDITTRQQILGAFADGIIDSYRKTGVNSFAIRVRSRDGDETPYLLTESGVRQLSAER